MLWPERKHPCRDRKVGARRTRRAPALRIFCVLFTEFPVVIINLLKYNINLGIYKNTR